MFLFVIRLNCVFITGNHSSRHKTPQSWALHHYYQSEATLTELKRKQNLGPNELGVTFSVVESVRHTAFYILSHIILITHISSGSKFLHTRIWTLWTWNFLKKPFRRPSFKFKIEIRSYCLITSFPVTCSFYAYQVGHFRTAELKFLLYYFSCAILNSKRFESQKYFCTKNQFAPSKINVP